MYDDLTGEMNKALKILFAAVRQVLGSICYCDLFDFPYFR